uniref:Uncharacterized protein n=1 Tax=Aegilops tauschii TaxID=37682 RepID=M8CRM5_AEGTA
MAEMVCTVSIGEAVNRTTSVLLGKEEREAMRISEGVERLDLAHIKMEAAIEVSRKWIFIDASLVRWRKMLKRAGYEYDEALQGCRQRTMDMQETDQEKAGETSSTNTASVVRRFERFADNAGEFIRFVELGGEPRQHMFYDPLIRHLLAGKELNYELSRGSGRHFFGVRPICFVERGVKAKLCYDYQDQKAPQNSFVLGAMLRLSDSTDIVGVMLTCLQTVITPTLALSLTPSGKNSHSFYLTVNCRETPHSLAILFHNNTVFTSGYQK